MKRVDVVSGAALCSIRFKAALRQETRATEPLDFSRVSHSSSLAAPRSRSRHAGIWKNGVGSMESGERRRER